MNEWRTDEQKAADSRAEPWELAHASVFIGLWVLGTALSLFTIVDWLFQ